MKKERIFTPQPHSTFLLVKCQKCENEQVIYSMTNTNILCKVCETPIAGATGGKANIYGVILRKLD